MLFNMDRNTKSNLLQMYKKEAEEHALKKQEERQRKINEEREYLQQVDQRENAREDRMRLDKIRKINEHMNDYQKMLQYQNQNQSTKIKSRISDVKINNYGFNIAGGNSLYREYSNRPSSLEPAQMQSSPSLNSNANSFYYPPSREYPQKEIDLVRKEDHMGNYLTDKQNDREVKDYFMNQKNEQKKYYKDLLDSQCSKNKNTPQTANSNIQNANIINHYKRFNLANDPFNIRKNNDFGESKLERNPILNPVNNLDYNRYLNFPIKEAQMQMQDPNYINMNRNMDQYQPPQQEQYVPNAINEYSNNINGNSNNYQYQPRQDQYNPNPNPISDYNNNSNNEYQPRQDPYMNNDPYQGAPNRMNDYGNMNMNNQYQPNDNYSQPIQGDYQNNRSIPYKYNDGFQAQSQGQGQGLSQTMRNSSYQPEHIPTPTGQRLIQAGASSMMR